MAIISCPECSNPVSNKATNCPHCGFLIASKIIEMPISKKDLIFHNQNQGNLSIFLLGTVIFLVLGTIFVTVNINKKSLECNQFKSIQEVKYYLENPNSIKNGAEQELGGLQEKTTQILNKLESMQISDDNLKKTHRKYVANYQKLSLLYSSGLETLKKIRGFQNEIIKGKPKTVETDRLASQIVEESISIINQIKFVSEETKSIDLQFAKICSSN